MDQLDEILNTASGQIWKIFIFIKDTVYPMGNATCSDFLNPSLKKTERENKSWPHVLCDRL